MSDRDRGLRRLVLRFKAGSETAKKKIPRRLFLGVRFKETSAFLCPIIKPEDRK